MASLGRKALKGISKHYFWLSLLLFSIFFLWCSNLLTLINPSLGKFILRIISNSSGIDTLLTTISAVLGTILAISFSISIVVIQNAASSYTASILEIYKKDFRTLFFFFYYFLSLMFAIIALQTLDLYIVNMTLVMFFFSFLFLLMHFYHIVNLIDPRTIIEKAKNKALKNINQIPSKIQRRIEHEKTTSEFEKQILEGPMYSHFLLHNDLTLLALSKQKVLQISDVILKASSRREIETSIKGFESLTEIALNYVNIRKDDPTSEDSFLVYIYNELLSISRVGFENKDISLMQEVIKTFEKIGCYTADIKSMGDGPNLVAGLVTKYVYDLGIDSFERNFQDVTAQAISSVMILGLVAIRKTGGTGLAQDYIFDMGKRGAQNNSWYILGNTLKSLKELLWEAITKQLNVYSEPTTILEHISALAILGINNGLDRSSFLYLFPMFPEFSISRAAVIAISIKNGPYPRIETYQRETYSKAVLEILSARGNTCGIIKQN